VLLGIVPTPEVAYLARHRAVVGLAATPSHNALGYAGLKGFTRSGRLFDREWREIGRAYQRTEARPHRPRIGGARDEPNGPPRGDARAGHDAYLAHLTGGLSCGLTVVLDTRGGATAIAAPAAFRRLGARVIETTRGFSPRFFGQSPEPRAGTMAALADRIRSVRADLGFAFDGDGDRCVVLDNRGGQVAPEIVALLLHRAFAGPRSPLVASADASRVLERHVRTIRSRVGGRFVTRAMRRAGAEVGVEPSGHYYVRRYGADSDGILVACLVAHALSQERLRLSSFARRFGGIHRGTFTVDFPSLTEAREGYRAITRGLGPRARRALDGVTVDRPEEWCLIRCSNTQPSIRFAFEAKTALSLRRLEKELRDVAEPARASVRVPTRP